MVQSASKKKLHQAAERKIKMFEQIIQIKTAKVDVQSSDETCRRKFKLNNVHTNLYADNYMYINITVNKNRQT